MTARAQLDASEETSNLGGRGHARRKHAGIQPKELQKIAAEEDHTITAYLTKEDQDRALAAATEKLRENLSDEGSIRDIPIAERVETGRFPIIIADKTSARRGWSSSINIIRDPGRRDNNIVTAYPVPEKQHPKKNVKRAKSKSATRGNKRVSN